MQHTGDVLLQPGTPYLTPYTFLKVLNEFGNDFGESTVPVQSSPAIVYPLSQIIMLGESLTATRITGICSNSMQVLCVLHSGGRSVRERGTKLLQEAQNSLDQFLQMCTACAPESIARQETMHPNTTGEPVTPTQVAHHDNVGTLTQSLLLSRTELQEMENLFVQQEDLELDPDDISMSGSLGEVPPCGGVCGGSSVSVKSDEGVVTVERFEDSLLNNVSMPSNKMNSSIVHTVHNSSNTSHNPPNTSHNPFHDIPSTAQNPPISENQSALTRSKSSSSAVESEGVDGGKAAILLYGVSSSRDSFKEKKGMNGMVNSIEGGGGERGEWGGGGEGEWRGGGRGEGGGEVKRLEESFVEFDDLIGEFKSPDEFLSRVIFHFLHF